MIKENNKKLIIFGELFLLSLLIWVINIRFPENYGFWTVPINPYVAVAVFISVYYGRNYGFLSFGFSIILLLIPIVPETDVLSYWKELFAEHYRYYAIVIVAIYIFGIVNKNFSLVVENQRLFMRRIAKDKIRLEKEIKGIEAVNREFEERVLLQNDSITALYNQINALHSQNLTKSLNTLLGTVQEFTWAEKISIWEYQKESDSLVMIANIGWGIEDIEYSIEDVNSSISGWVFRNNKIFSVRMIMDNEAFQRMDKKRNILTYPINTSNSRWGVLNIESMPFPKFNLYTERILSILVDLAGPAIERAVEYESIIKHADVNAYTGLPSPAQFMNLISKEIRKAFEKGNGFSIVLIEIPAFDEIIEKYGNDKAYRIILKLFNRMNALAENKLDFFHYKKQNQFAIFFPGADYDGAAFLCFESLGLITSTDWTIDDERLDLEVLFGYSAMGKDEVSVEELVDGAERLLEMQKV